MGRLTDMPKVREGGVVRKDSAETEHGSQLQTKCIKLYFKIIQREITLVPLWHTHPEAGVSGL